jgi:hypothetical protein
MKYAMATMHCWNQVGLSVHSLETNVYKCAKIQFVLKSVQKSAPKLPNAYLLTHVHFGAVSHVSAPP